MPQNCGSWLASDGGGSVDGDVGWGGPIAGKPAPTRISGVPEIVGIPQNLWELALLAMAVGQSTVMLIVLA
jgi:hypothetical protein